ncbi:hypothetical protein CEY12_02750 [Chryseobacterium sp. T16E-39]|nr:hypothetical protein CEY12_02750 [Chryseobacterium sp. T16E-39]
MVWGQSPGGVNNGLRIWLKANDGFSPSSWTDHSGSGNHFTQSNGSRRPSLITASPKQNFNSFADFGSSTRSDGRFMVVPDGRPYTNITANTVLIAVSAKNLRGYHDYLGFGATTTGSAVRQANRPVITNNNQSDTSVRLYPSKAYTSRRTLNKTHLADFSYTVGGTIRGGLDGQNTSGGSERLSASRSRLSRGAILGSQREVAAADIGEVIGFQRELTQPEKDRVRSYLAVKYGVTLSQPQNYIASDGSSIIWNSSRNSSFNNNVFGLVKDDNSALDQKISNSINNGAILTVATDNDFTSANSTRNRRSFTVDKTFLMFGDNNATTTSLTNVPAAVNPTGERKRIQRVWQVERTNDSGSVWLQADLSTYAINTNIFMMVADDANFQTNLVLVPGVINNDGKVVFNYNFPQNKYITFGGEITEGNCVQCTGGKTFKFRTGFSWRQAGASGRNTNMISDILLGNTTQGPLKVVRMVSDYTENPSMEYRPRVFPSIYRGTWVRTRRYDNTDAVARHFVEFNQSVKARFQISNINTYLRNGNLFTVKGYCDGKVVYPKVTYAYPVNNRTTFKIDANLLTGIRPFRGFTYLYSTANIVFDRPVQKIEIECRVNRVNARRTLRSLTWGDMAIECAANPEPSADNMHVYQSFTTNPVYSCNETTMIMKIVNSNSSDKTINIVNNLPAGLHYIPDSYNDVELPGNPQPTYGGQAFTLNNLVVPPGEHTLYINVKSSNNIANTYETQADFTVLDSGNAYKSDGDASVPGYQTSPLEVLEGQGVDVSKFKLKKTVNASCGTNNKKVTYTLTVENNSGAAITGANLEENLEDGQTIDSYTLNGITGTPAVDPIGSTIFHLYDVNIPVGISTIDMVVDLQDSYTTNNNSEIASQFIVEIDPESPCSESSTISSNLLILPFCGDGGVCTKDPATGTPNDITRIGISGHTNLQTNWPATVPNGFIALESKDKGFVITRTTSDKIVRPVEGMLIFDTADKCFKLYNGTSWKCISRSCND